MRCFKPIKLKNGNLVPCGKCAACQINRQSQWRFRLEKELANSDFYLWITLTYEENSLRFYDEKSGSWCTNFGIRSGIGRPAVNVEDCKLFFKRLRKRFPKVKFKYFLVSEYGGRTYRPHYHFLLFCSAFGGLRVCLDTRRQIVDSLENLWRCGFAYEKRYHKGVLAYLTKYCCKPEIVGFIPPVKTFTLCSKGLGISYLDYLQTKDFSDLDFRVRHHGGDIVLPRYYRDKLFPHSGDNVENRLAWDSYLREMNIKAQKDFQLIAEKHNKVHEQDYLDYYKDKIENLQKDFDLQTLKRLKK